MVAYKNAWMEPFVENESESSESCESSTSKRGSSVATDDVVSTFMHWWGKNYKIEKSK